MRQLRGVWIVKIVLESVVGGDSHFFPAAALRPLRAMRSYVGFVCWLRSLVY